MERNHRKKASENCTKQQINRLELDKKRRDAESEIDQLLSQLDLTVSDIHSLQNEVKLIRSMGKNSHNSCSIKCGVEKASLVQAAEAELEVAKKELVRFKEEGFKLMDEMDAIREEIHQVAKEKQRSSSIRKRLESIVEQLNYELRSSKSKLEVASSAQKRASDIVFDLPVDLRQLQAVRDAAERDAESTHEAIEAFRSELMKTESSVLYVEERLQAAMEEMKAAITFEAIAEQKLRAIAHSNSSNRANSSLYGSTITISKFEHYLIEQAKAAQEISGQRVEAAQAWIEALATGQDGDHNNQRRRLSTSSRKPFAPKKTIKTKLSVHEADKKQVQSLDSKLAPATRRRSFTLSRVPDQSRRVKLRRSAGSSKAQPAVVSSDTCLAVGRKKIILKLIKFLGGSGSANKS
ncbi:protein PLASTID MOVEMENT IMPAIRED 2-like [Curcuma longa]|uniref:protein PLASTID MOVEMENT IMPAIRED 2-like n=1 Tax=Curcuma longa TaxID=136217 RepID=UPI003D9E4A7A